MEKLAIGIAIVSLSYTLFFLTIAYGPLFMKRIVRLQNVRVSRNVNPDLSSKLRNEGLSPNAKDKIELRR